MITDEQVGTLERDLQLAFPEAKIKKSMIENAANLAFTLSKLDRKGVYSLSDIIADHEIDCEIKPGLSLSIHLN